MPRITDTKELVYNAFAGESMFILCTGPSIAKEDLTPLRDYWTFGTGQIYKWDKLPFQPSIYGVDETVRHVPGPGEPVWDSESWDAIHATDMCGFISSAPYYDSNRWYVMGTPHAGVEIADGYLAGLTDKPLLHNIPSQKGVSAFAVALQPALWLGFDPIYFLGLDLSDEYVTGEPRDEEVRPENKSPISEWTRIIRSVQVVNDSVKEAGRTVVNLSQTTNEDILPKDMLKAVLERMDCKNIVKHKRAVAA